MKPKKLTKRQKQKLLDKFAGQAMAAMIARNGLCDDEAYFQYGNLTPMMAYDEARDMLEFRESMRRRAKAEAAE